MMCGSWIWRGLTKRPSGAYGRHGDILLEACKYIPGLTADAVEPGAEELLTRWW